MPKNLTLERSYHDLIKIKAETENLDEAQFSRLSFALSYYEGRLEQMADWVFASKERGNFTYDISPLTKAAFAGAVSAAVGIPLLIARKYIEEIDSDDELAASIVQRAGSEAGFDTHDATCLYGRRVAWYAIVRAKKPAVVVETGVQAGLGSMVLAAALRRNTAEGKKGHHYGTDIDPKAGFLMHGPWAEFSTFLYGDSIESLSGFDKNIDVFINDSDHSSEYESSEYRTITGRISKQAIVLGDNSHVTDSLYRWSIENNRNYLFCNEYPKNHWYPGAGVGISFEAPRQPAWGDIPLLRRFLSALKYN